MPQSPRLVLLPHRAPHFIDFSGYPTTLRQLVSTTDLDLDMLGVQLLQHRMISLLKVSSLFFERFNQVVVYLHLAEKSAA
jgi:hypothetical protein